MGDVINMGRGVIVEMKINSTSLEVVVRLASWFAKDEDPFSRSMTWMTATHPFFGTSPLFMINRGKMWKVLDFLNSAQDLSEVIRGVP